jgi:hypothetical protein
MVIDATPTGQFLAGILGGLVLAIVAASALARRLQREEP